MDQVHHALPDGKAPCQMTDGHADSRKKSSVGSEGEHEASSLHTTAALTPPALTPFEKFEMLKRV
jgi:hypothetical protein